MLTGYRLAGKAVYAAGAQCGVCVLEDVTSKGQVLGAKRQGMQEEANWQNKLESWCVRLVQSKRQAVTI